MLDSCKMTIDGDTTVESPPLSLDSGDHAFAMGLENKLQENDTVEKSRMTGQGKRKAPKGKGKGMKKRCQTNDVVEPSEAFEQPDSAIELESQQPASDIVQGQANNKMKKLIPVRPRKRQAPNELPKAKGKGHQTFNVSQPLEPTGNENPVRVLIFDKNKSPVQVLKILRDRVIRRVKNDQHEDMAKCIELLKDVMKFNAKSHFPLIVKSIDKISRQWPARSDLSNILNDIKREHAMSKHSTFDEKRILRFEAIEQAIKTSDDMRARDSAKAIELDNIFVGEDVDPKTQREKLFASFPWLFLGENATNESPKDNILEEISATEVSADFPRHCLKDSAIWDIPGEVGEEFPASMFTTDLPSDFWEANASNDPAASLQKRMEDLQNELFDENNCNVEVSEFHGLQDAINGAQDGIPDHLKSIAMKIEQDRGERTPANRFYQQLLVLVSAAVKEAEDLPVYELNRAILRKWAATFNLANLMQFRVPILSNLLVKNMHAYLHYSILNPGSEN
ncbi:hypothetical protein GQ457_06G003520 [Hibiscus cannabinus]